MASGVSGLSELCSCVSEDVAEATSCSCLAEVSAGMSEGLKAAAVAGVVVVGGVGWWWMRKNHGKNVTPPEVSLCNY